jgi:redox-sensitive bicupin YhaK (pirin superfamily)
MGCVPEPRKFQEGERILVERDAAGARLMALGGATMGGSRFIWWNFAASSRERIEAVKAERRAARRGEGRFDLPAASRDEFIPLL